MKGRGFVEEWKRQNDYLRAVLIELGVNNGPLRNS